MKLFIDRSEAYTNSLGEDPSVPGHDASNLQTEWLQDPQTLGNPVEALRPDWQLSLRVTDAC